MLRYVEMDLFTFTTSGPVIKRYEVSLTIKVQSVKAGEYTAPPAHGPAKKLIHVRLRSFIFEHLKNQ